MASRQNNFFQVCSKCRSLCCKNARPPLTGKRMKIIGGFLAAQGLRIESPFCGKAYTFPRETSEGLCVFLDNKARKCLVHSVKPETCVAGPITFDINLQAGRIEWFLKSEGICPLAGLLYRNKEALESHLRSAKKELQTLVSELDSEALCAILRIEEPETFKIGEDPLSLGIRERLLRCLRVLRSEDH